MSFLLKESGTAELERQCFPPFFRPKNFSTRSEIMLRRWKKKVRCTNQRQGKKTRGIGSPGFPNLAAAACVTILISTCQGLILNCLLLFGKLQLSRRVQTFARRFSILFSLIWQLNWRIRKSSKWLNHVLNSCISYGLGGSWKEI